MHSNLFLFKRCEGEKSSVVAYGSMDGLYKDCNEGSWNSIRTKVRDATQSAF